LRFFRSSAAASLSAFSAVGRRSITVRVPATTETTRVLDRGLPFSDQLAVSRYLYCLPGVSGGERKVRSGPVCNVLLLQIVNSAASGNRTTRRALSAGASSSPRAGGDREKPTKATNKGIHCRQEGNIGSLHLAARTVRLESTGYSAANSTDATRHEVNHSPFG
jgi:hypothetical protein